jgi:hypothetical protein
MSEGEPLIGDGVTQGIVRVGQGQPPGGAGQGLHDPLLRLAHVTLITAAVVFGAGNPGQ